MSLAPFSRDALTKAFGDFGMVLLFEQYMRVVSSIAPSPTTFANLPSPAKVQVGTRAYITDAGSTTFNAIIAAGGGANSLWVTSDGTNWRIG